MKFTFLFLLTFILFDSIQAQSNQTDNQSLLWEISGRDLTENSYLFGTMHLIPDEDFHLSSSLDSVFRNCEAVILEVNLNEMQDFDAFFEIIMQSFMSDTTLSDLVDEHEYKIIGDHFSKKGIPISMVNKIKPMILYALSEGEGFNSEKNLVSYDLKLYEKALSNEKQIGGLETVAYQLSIFDSISYKDQARLLVQSIQMAEDNSEMLNQMVELYKEGSIEDLYNMVAMDNENINRVMIHNRNFNWIMEMEKTMEKQSCFFAVGAGHLGGSKGLIQLLKEKGYNVNPILEYR